MTDSTTAIGSKPAKPVDAATDAEEAAVRTTEPAPRKPLRGGWRIIAGKELGDHLASIRFTILLLVMALTGLVVVGSVASSIQTAAPELSQSSSVFLLLFTLEGDQIPWSFIDLMGILAPLLGLAFGFTAINSERVNRTLPRLVSQPIHRDDVIRGKFAAGLALIALTVATLMALVCGYGIVVYGITPSADDFARMITFGLVIVLHVGVWLALGILLSVLTRSAVTAVLAGIGLWLALALFAPLPGQAVNPDTGLREGVLSGVVADFVSPAGVNATFDEQVANARTEIWVRRVSPQGVYDETASVLLNPQARSVDILTGPQLDQALFTKLDYDQSLLLVWPQIVALVAMTVALFAYSFIKFLEQEIRA